MLETEQKYSIRNPREHSLVVDPEMGDRYESLVKFGKIIFRGSNLTRSKRTKITEEDLLLIERWHAGVSPLLETDSWRVNKDVNRSVMLPVRTIGGDAIQIARIVDNSTYGNWDMAGGPLEHIHLATKAARIITELIQRNLRPDSALTPPYRNFVKQVKKLSPLHAAAAAALHDDGRLLTHGFFTTDAIGKALLRKIIRQDLREVMPSESVMLSEEGKMLEMILSLPAEAVIIRIADEFGKRVPKTNRLYQPSDYDAWDRQAWVNGYINRPESGRPSDRFFRKNQQKHIDNVPAYFDSLAKWVESVSTLTLEEITQLLNKVLSPTLTQLPE